MVLQEIDNIQIFSYILLSYYYLHLKIILLKFKVRKYSFRQIPYVVNYHPSF